LKVVFIVARLGQPGTSAPLKRLKAHTLFESGAVGHVRFVRHQYMPDPVTTSG
jgi:hypothetical protein